MDILGDILAPYSSVIAKCVCTVTCLHYMSGGFLLNEIRKVGSSDGYPPDPFLGGVVLTVLSCKLGTLMGDEAMVKVNMFGFCINVIFTMIHFWYASGPFKMKIWTKIGVAGVFTITCLAYASFEDPYKIEFRFGMLITALLIGLVGMPLLELDAIINRKTTDGLSLPMTLAGAVVSAAWVIYAISIKNSMLTYQNALLLILSSIQLSLFAIYPSTISLMDKGPSLLFMEQKHSNKKTSNPLKDIQNKKFN
uniref:Sugar transporter SWEET n=1 Tax=Glossina austeni TaxID=7395 RepID=A0A1A9USW8_GLOAU